MVHFIDSVVNTTLLTILELYAESYLSVATGGVTGGEPARNFDRHVRVVITGCFTDVCSFVVMAQLGGTKGRGPTLSHPSTCDIVSHVVVALRPGSTD